MKESSQQYCPTTNKQITISWEKKELRGNQGIVQVAKSKYSCSNILVCAQKYSEVEKIPNCLLQNLSNNNF